MLKQSISDHPVITGVKRQVEVLEIKFDDVASKINMELKITHKFNDVEIADLDKKIRLIADNSRTIGETPDYDYIIQQVEADAHINTLISSIINQRDVDGTINQKMGYAPQEEI